MIFWDVAGPIPGSASSSSLVAEFISILPEVRAAFFVVLVVVVVVVWLAELSCAPAGIPAHSNNATAQTRTAPSLFIASSITPYKWKLRRLIWVASGKLPGNVSGWG